MSSGPTARSATSQADPRAWRSPLLAGAVAGAALLTRLPGLVASRAFNPDEATLAVGGEVVAGGGALYVDYLDRKPPLPFAVYALVQRATGTTDLRWVRGAVLVLVVAAALVLASEAGRRWGPRAAWVAGLATVGCSAALPAQDAQAANFELFALLPIVVAVVAAARGRPIAAGVALAFAVLCKQPAAVTAVPVAWSLWRGGGVRALATCGAAGAGTTALLAAPFGIHLVLDWALLGTGGYLDLDSGEVGVASVRLLALTVLVAGFWLGAWLLVVSGRRPSAPTPGAPAGSHRGDGPAPDERDVWILLAASIVGVAAGFRFFPHYLVQLVPPVALLAARGATIRPARLRAAAVLAVASVAVAGTAAWATALAAPPAIERRVAAFVERSTEPEDRILVWGNYPELYWRTGRGPAGGFPHSEFFTGYSGGRKPHLASEAVVPDEDVYDDLITQLRDDPPALVVDVAAAGVRGGRWFPLERFPTLVDVFERRYRLVAVIEGARIYEPLSRVAEGRLGGGT